MRNLERYQHYSNRNPPWVKLHADVLENYDFGQLPDATKAHALLLLPLAARLGNRIPANPQWIAGRIQAQSRVDLELLVSAKFLEVIEGEGEAPETPAPSVQESISDEGSSRAEIEWRVQRCWSDHLLQWKAFYTEVNGVPPRQDPKLTSEIRVAIREALLNFDSDLLKESHREKWARESKARAAGIGIFLDPFLTGKHKDNDTSNGGKRYLEHWRPWKRQRGKGDPVERFAELYFEATIGR